MLEDSTTDAEIVQQLLKKKKPHCEFSLAMSKEDYLLALDEFKPDIIIANNSLPRFSAAEALEISRRRCSARRSTGPRRFQLANGHSKLARADGSCVVPALD